MRKRARDKLLEQSLCDRTLAMRHTPRHRLRERALRGHWPGFPISPARAYEALSVDDEHYGMYAAARLADQLTEAVLEMEAAIDGAAAKLLAVRRAALTALYEAQECANDSLGELGRAASEALASYVSSPWRDSGVDAKEAQAVTAYAQVAADAVDRFVSTAEWLGSARWQPLDAMVRHACARHRVDIARDLLDAADVPGFHQNWVRERRTSLAGDAP